MSNRIVVLGSGAAPGVPCLSRGWGDCNSENPKNRRLRTSVYLEYKENRILIDASPDLREQLLIQDIKKLDAVIYTHPHADHILGTDYLREINRLTKEEINIYGGEKTLAYLKQVFPHLVGADFSSNMRYGGSLVPHRVNAGEAFYVNDIKIAPFKIYGHSEESFGYVFDDGELVYISDFKEIDEEIFELINVKPKILVIPLTTPHDQPRHAGLEVVLNYIDKIGAERVIINHMASECDFDEINSATPENVSPAFDNLSVEF